MKKKNEKEIAINSILVIMNITTLYNFADGYQFEY